MLMEALTSESFRSHCALVFFSAITISWLFWVPTFGQVIQWFPATCWKQKYNFGGSAPFLIEWWHHFHWVGFSNFSLFPCITPSLLTLPSKLIPLPVWLSLLLLTPLPIEPHLFEFPSVTHCLRNRGNGNDCLQLFSFSSPARLFYQGGLLRRGFGLFKSTQYSQTGTKFAPVCNLWNDSLHSTVASDLEISQAI